MNKKTSKVPCGKDCLAPSICAKFGCQAKLDSKPGTKSYKPKGK